MKKHFLFFWLIIQLSVIVKSQMPVGSWRDHLCYSVVKKVLKVGDKIYCAAEQSIFIYSTADNSFQKLSTITGLSDVGVNNLAYYKERDILFITYTNGNIDLIHNNLITNIPDLKHKVINSRKGANHIIFKGDFAYCSYDFGILLIDIVKNEVKDTYIIGEPGIIYPVNSLAIVDDYFYAATNKGIFKASITDPFLIDFNRWQRQTSIPFPNRKFGIILTFQNKTIINSIGENAADTLYALNNGNWEKLQNIGYFQIKEMAASENHLVITCLGNVFALNQNFQVIDTFNRFTPQCAISDDVNLWIGDFGNGLIKRPLGGSDESYYYPQGPISNSIWNMKVHNNTILVTAGGVDASWGPISYPGLVSKYQDNSWFNIGNYNARDFVSICGDPDDPEKIYVGSWGNGVYVYNNSNLIVNYTEKNSSIRSSIVGVPYMMIGGITFDNEKNMWLTNQHSSAPISVRKHKPDTSWIGYNYTLLKDFETVGDIINDINGNFWVVVPRSSGMFAFDINNTIDNFDDDSTLRFRPKDAYDKTIDNIFCAVNDKDGSVWLGTERGPVVYTDPEGIFHGETDGYQPRVPRNDGQNGADALLGGESVFCIAVDGANRKWFGTEKGGAFLLSADGTKQILNFTSENSPLFSNLVRAIAIHPKTGEVFFGTDKGIISYRGVASEPEGGLSGAYVFPNPVRPEFQGNITISGLVENTSVKITDISGNLVYQTTSLGGSAAWDGKNRKGNRAATGVYLIFLTNEDGTFTNVIKLLVVR